jgi:hypothetical protein
METLQSELELAASSIGKVLFRKQVQRELDEIRQEAEEAYALDNEIDPVPDSAYHDVYAILDILCYNNVPMPDIGWLADGGIGFEWRSQHVKGIGTMSIYGDNKVIYGASLGSGHKDKGTCELTNLVKLVRFLPMLKTLCPQ